LLARLIARRAKNNKESIKNASATSIKLISKAKIIQDNSYEKIASQSKILASKRTTAITIFIFKSYFL
jgi:hypothetical protein